MENKYDYLIENILTPNQKDTGTAVLEDLKNLLPLVILEPVMEHEKSNADMPFKIEIFDGNNHYIIERIK